MCWLTPRCATWALVWLVTGGRPRCRPGCEPSSHSWRTRYCCLPWLQVALRLYGVPEASSAAVCTFPDMKVGWQRRDEQQGSSEHVRAASHRPSSACQSQHNNRAPSRRCPVPLRLAAMQSAVDTATLVMQSGIPVARIELMDELQVGGWSCTRGGWKCGCQRSCSGKMSGVRAALSETPAHVLVWHC